MASSDVDLGDWIVRYIDQVDQAVEDTATAVAEVGQQAMYDMIDTRGTGKTWSRSWGGRSGSLNGRVDTGQMRADIEQFAGRKGKTTAIAQAGWLYNFEDYYGYQEAGFTHYVTGEEIKGMGIMADAEDLMVHEAERELGKRLRNV